MQYELLDFIFLNTYCLFHAHLMLYENEHPFMITQNDFNFGSSIEFDLCNCLIFDMGNIAT